VTALSRRRLLAGGALVVAFSMSGRAFAQDGKLPGNLAKSPLLDSWIRVNADGRITVLTGKAELGQGLKTALIQIAAVQGRKVRTLEGLVKDGKPGPLSQAFEAEHAAQCGYCIAGMIVRAQALLEANNRPTEAELRTHMAANLCRCGTHMRILRAIRRAAAAMGGGVQDVAEHKP